MQTLNSFHHTPQEIVNFMQDFFDSDWHIVDLCAGNGALTNGFECNHLTSIDINKKLLEKIEQGEKICANVLALTNKNLNEEQKKVQTEIIIKIEDADCFVMNPPFENYKDFLNVAFELMREGCFGIFILPKRAIKEMEWNNITNTKVFEQVDFGTANTDIVVVTTIKNGSHILTAKNQISLVVNNQVAKFLAILSKSGFILGNTYKGTFIHDSYTSPYEIGKVEWRTDFTFDGNEYAVSTFFDVEYQPNINDIVLQVQQYMSFWSEFFIDSSRGTHYAKEKYSFDSSDLFLNEVDEAICYETMEYLGYENPKLEDFRKLSYRLYQDYKIFTPIISGNLQLFFELLNVDLEPLENY